MRTLLLTASLPYPPTSGGALRVYGILHGLHQAGHAITLMAFDDPAQTLPAPLTALCQRIVTLPIPARSRRKRLSDLVTTSHADIARRLYSREAEQRISALLRAEHFDLIQFEGIEVACYLPISKALSPQSTLCFDTFNAEAELQRRIYEIDSRQPRRWLSALYSYIQSRRIRRYEGDLCRLAHHVVAVSAEDAAFLRAYRQDQAVTIVPSGIFAADYDQPVIPAPLPDHALVFTGKMDYRPNVDAMLWFMNAMLPRLPGAHLVIGGQQPHPLLQAAAQQQPNVTLTGRVASVQPYLCAASVYIAPLRMGSGTRLKILEAMACGCAIVATPLAATGLSADAHAAMLLADDPASFAQAVTRLLADPAERRRLGALARVVVREQYDWSVLIPQLIRMYGKEQRSTGLLI